MTTIMEWVVKGHVALGFAGLAAFWVPIVVRKGGPTHIRFGTIYKWCAYVVLATAGVSVVYRIGSALAAGRSPADSANEFAVFIFLGYLAFVTFATVRHGVGVLRTRKEPERLRTPINMALAYGSIAFSAFIIAYALYFRPGAMILLLALSPIGLLVGRGTLKYINGPRPSPRQWMYEHLGAMIGGGIAFHTAFAVFGVNQMFNLGLDGWLAIVPWVAPAAIGIPATALWTRHYQKKFGEIETQPST